MLVTLLQYAACEGCKGCEGEMLRNVTLTADEAQFFSQTNGSLTSVQILPHAPLEALSCYVLDVPAGLVYTWRVSNSRDPIRSIRAPVWSQGGRKLRIAIL